MSAKPAARAGGFLGLLAVSIGIVSAKAQLGKERPRLGLAADALAPATSPMPRATITIYPSPSTRATSPQPGQVARPVNAATVAPAPQPPAGGARTINGDVVDTEFGPVQTAVTVASARIADVRPLTWPQDDPESIEINKGCLPTLRSQVLKAQSADIDGVSGCTVTAQAYALSVQSALDRA